jgi:hypothetical protein
MFLYTLCLKKVIGRIIYILLYLLNSFCGGHIILFFSEYKMVQRNSSFSAERKENVITVKRQGFFACFSLFLERDGPWYCSLIYLIGTKMNGHTIFYSFTDVFENLEYMICLAR